MNLNSYLLDKCKNLNNKDIHEYSMEIYDNFYYFIENHYSLEHMKKNNYIKYIKVMRQKLLNDKPDEYNFLLNKINQLINLLFRYNLFPNLVIRKYLFKIYKFLKILDVKKNNIIDTIKYYEKLYETYNDKDDVKFKILMNINGYNTKFQVYSKISKEIKYHINNLINLEEKYDIDHKLIEINNLERGLLGKKSEYLVDKIIKSYILQSKKNYFYIQNIDIIKLFNLKINEIDNLKGEIDGMLLIKVENEYFIEKVIEVKSSIKATFEDIIKFINLINKIKDLDDKYYFLDNVKLSKKSFSILLNNNIHEWLIYICQNEKKTIEKSHFYFSHVLKIVDNEFIKRYYIENDKKIIDEKFDIITKNKEYVNNLFNEWKDVVNLNDKDSIIFLLK